METAQGSVIGNYLILMPLGKSGMGTVYEVKHEKLGAVAWARASMTVTADVYAAGFTLVRARTGEAFDFSPPPNAAVCDEWRSRECKV